MEKQSFNLNSDFLGGFSAIFMKLVILIVVVYILIMIMNFLRDKFINQGSLSKRDDIVDLLTIFNKLFYISGFGFILGNIVQVILNEITNRNSYSMNFRGDWDYLTFGVILIFMGIGFKYGKAVLKKDRVE